jgi:hypothetical protein
LVHYDSKRAWYKLFSRQAKRGIKIFVVSKTRQLCFSMRRWVTSPKTPINPPGNLVRAQSITQAADSLEAALAGSHALWNNGINKKAAFRRLLPSERAESKKWINTWGRNPQGVIDYSPFPLIA